MRREIRKRPMKEKIASDWGGEIFWAPLELECGSLHVVPLVKHSSWSILTPATYKEKNPIPSKNKEENQIQCNLSNEIYKLAHVLSVPCIFLLWGPFTASVGLLGGCTRTVWPEWGLSIWASSGFGPSYDCPFLNSALREKDKKSLVINQSDPNNRGPDLHHMIYQIQAICSCISSHFIWWTLKLSKQYLSSSDGSHFFFFCRLKGRKTKFFLSKPKPPWFHASRGAKQKMDCS